LRRFDAVIAVSASIASKLRASGVPQEKIHVVLNAFSAGSAPLSRQAAKRVLDAPNYPLIGWVGRLSREKGPDIALEAFAMLRHPHARLLIIGEGRDQSSLYERARELGVSDRILWRGVVANAERVFPAFDAFLLSSRAEGTPIVLLEAMAASVPIVATRVGGVPDVVDQSSALLVDAGDAKGIAQALDEVLSRPARAQARAKIALSKLTKQFGIEPWLSRYESVYRTVIRSDKRAFDT
jgi:glycosyltransferase involved in cell wall biosynthesis